MSSVPVATFSRKASLVAALVLAVTLAYANHFTNGFHFDDGHAITANPAVRSLAEIPRFFTDTTTSSVLPANQTYRPIVSTSLAIDYALGHGYSPIWFQSSTFIIFIIQLVAMYALFSRIAARSQATVGVGMVPLMATAWYGLHPAIAETINYIVQRADVYSTCGVVVALTLYARSPKLRRSGLYLVPALLAMFSKAPAVVFPLLLFAYIVLFETKEVDRDWQDAVRRMVPATALAIASLVVQHAMTPPTFLPTTLSASAYIGTQPYVLLRYALTFFLPVHLNVDSDLRALPATAPAAVLGDVFLVAVIVVGFVAARTPRFRPAAFGLFWFVIADIPTAVFPLSELENDHRMYFPFVGLVFAVTWTLALGIADLTSDRNRWFVRRIVPIACVALLACSAAGTVHRNQVWHTDEALWYDASQKSPLNGRALMNYGLSEMELGKYAAAKIAFDRARLLIPDYPSLEINEGVLAIAMNRDADAEPHFKRAIELAPRDEQARAFYARWLRGQARTSESLREATIGASLTSPALESRTVEMDDLADLGRGDEARAVASGTLALVPNDDAARAFLAHGSNADRSARYWLGKSLEAYHAMRYLACIDAAKRALALTPSLAEAYNNIGVAQFALHHYDEAIASERRALALEPSLELARNNLQWALAHRGR